MEIVKYDSGRERHIIKTIEEIKEYGYMDIVEHVASNNHYEHDKNHHYLILDYDFNGKKYILEYPTSGNFYLIIDKDYHDKDVDMYILLEGELFDKYVLGKK